MCLIGDQSRPELFDLQVRKAAVLHDAVVEVDERVTMADYDLNPTPWDEATKRARLADDPDHLVRTASGDVVRILRRPDPATVRAQLQALRDEGGYTSVAISFLHAYVFPDHEALVAELAREVGFAHVTTSSATSPHIKFLTRTTSTCSEAYLAPVLQRYLAQFLGEDEDEDEDEHHQGGFAIPPRRVEFMCSDGGLKQAHKVRGNEALLSGPAGGVVGVAQACYEQATDEGAATAVIGFDMGGTSTDVSRYDGRYDYRTEATLAGRTIHAPMLNIATVAAGGGSLLAVRNGLLVVGPESAGAHPGPACYRKGGPLTVTDANLFLGRLVPSSFPAIFGPTADQPLDAAGLVARFADLTACLQAQTTGGTPPARTPEEVALGFLHVANEAMSRPIRNATEARGFAPEKHHLACFGGAGGQHACAIADKLGIRRILIHRWSSLLSAHGISLAELQSEAVEPCAGKLRNYNNNNNKNKTKEEEEEEEGPSAMARTMAHVRARLAALQDKVRAELESQGAEVDSLVFEEALVLRYFGTDTNMTIARPADEDYARAFAETHLREFAFAMDRDIVIESLQVRGTGRAGGVQVAEKTSSKYGRELEEVLTTRAARSSRGTEEEEEENKKEKKETLVEEGRQRVYLEEGWTETAVYKLGALPQGTVLAGPALIIDDTQTIFVDPKFHAIILSNHVVLDRLPDKATKTTTSSSSSSKAAAAIAEETETRKEEEEEEEEEEEQEEDPIQLSVFAHRFMAIAEQMGNTLQRTSISTSIKERLDFSCAIFSPDGHLVANAPHIPIHLGSMQFAIQAQHRHWRGRLRDGDVLLTNHPQWGGTHLPDLTAVTPVFLSPCASDSERDDNKRIAFYVASRGHHTDIGGKGITSMMPESKELWEEGLSVATMRIVRDGVFLEDEVRAAFQRAGDGPGCSVTRRLQDNISDLKAQVSANQRGIVLLRRLCAEYTLPVVHRYMDGIQRNAEAAVRAWFQALARERLEEVRSSSSSSSSWEGTVITVPPPLTATDYLDDGTPIQVAIHMDAATGSATYDFTGSGPQLWGNYNCPVAITHATILYTIRCLLASDIPLNQGCLTPITIVVPPGSVLNPSPAVAICGSTLASQRVIDVILRAFGRHAASAGCASSFGWGMGGRDYYHHHPPGGGGGAEGEGGREVVVVPGWNYGETVGGGVGACAGYAGAHGTHVHSTNTRATDPEVIEKRTAVLVRRSEIRWGSGGRGRWAGGCGLTREVEARIPLTFSILSDRRVFCPYGMAGGEPGAKGENYAFVFVDEGPPPATTTATEEGGGGGGRKRKRERINLGGKAVVRLRAGEYMQINSSGGGGYGLVDE